MKNLLVTGGAGFIGSNFIHSILKKDPTVNIVNIDLLTYAGSLSNLTDIESDSRYVFINGDICDPDLIEKIFKQYSIDTIVHFAAESHVDRSIFHPEQFIQTNIFGTFVLLEAAKRNWVLNIEKGKEINRFHHVSTDEVFGSLEPLDPPFNEGTPYCPNSPYSASKASSDHLVRAYGQTYNLPYTISNCTNNYGPNQFPEKLIPLMILNAIQGKSLPVYGDGQQIRDWLFVEDHCEAIYQILINGKNGETYCIGGNNQPTNLEIIQKICSILDIMKPECAPHNQLIQYVSDRPGHDRRYAMDITKISTELNWRPRYDLQGGLEYTIGWYVNNLDWVSSVSNLDGYKSWISKNYNDRGAK